MSEITVEKTHALLEKLAEHVMNETPTKREMTSRFEQVEAKMNARFEPIEADIRQMKADIQQTKVDLQQTKVDLRQTKVDVQLTKLDVHQIKDDVQQTRRDIKSILNGLDSQAKEHEIFRLEQAAISKTLDRHENRITALEEKDQGMGR